MPLNLPQRWHTFTTMRLESSSSMRTRTCGVAGIDGYAPKPAVESASRPSVFIRMDQVVRKSVSRTLAFPYGHVHPNLSAANARRLPSMDKDRSGHEGSNTSLWRLADCLRIRINQPIEECRRCYCGVRTPAVRASFMGPTCEVTAKPREMKS